MRKQVYIIQHRLLNYRLTFFEKLKSAFHGDDIDIHLIHGSPTPFEQSKNDSGKISWATQVRQWSLRLGGKDLLWQRLPLRELAKGDLIILMQENRILSNYPWLLFGNRKGARIAYWGHGRNLQSVNPDGWREKWKRWWICKVDWWFAYTEATRDIVISDGFSVDRITVLNNAIDNEGLRRDLAAVDAQLLSTCRAEIGAAASDPIGIYCGSLYPDKKLEFLVQAADIIYSARRDFKLVIVGDGPSRSLLSEYAATRPWMTLVGSLTGLKKAAWLKLANAYLSPGAVGLHVLDAFCSGLPMLTTVNARHGPEIAYLTHDHDGLVLNDDPQLYGATYLELLANPDRLERLRLAAMASAASYTLDAMVDRFADGIRQCLTIQAQR